MNMNIDDVRKSILDDDITEEEMFEGIEQLSEMIETAKEIGMVAAKLTKAEIEAERIEAAGNEDRKRDKTILEPLLKNAESFIGGDSAMRSVAEYDVVNLSKHLLPAYVDNLAIKHLVGVQPMTGPVGLSYILKYTDGNGNDFSFDDEINDRKVSLEIITKAVEAGSRKLPIELTLEVFDDMRDLRCDTSNINIPNAIAEDIYEEVKSDIAKIAHKDSIDVTDNHTAGTIGVIINRFANEIARKTRRGAGNWVIVSETVAKIIKPALKYDLALTNRTYGYLDYIGNVGCITVYLDPKIKHNKMIIGYKGGSGEIDSGYFYCPYIPIMTDGPIINPYDFSPTIRFMTRNGKTTEQTHKIESVIENDDKEITTSVRYASNYYYEVTLDGLPILDDLVIEEPAEKKANVLNDEPSKSTFDDLFDNAMGILD